MNFISRLDHAIFGHNLKIEGTEWREQGALLQNPDFTDIEVKIEQSFVTKSCEFCGEERNCPLFNTYRALCECGAEFKGDHPDYLVEKLKNHHEKHNHEKCNICGKLFTGEHAAQKKGGHKASAH